MMKMKTFLVFFCFFIGVSGLVSAQIRNGNGDLTDGEKKVKEVWHPEAHVPFSIQEIDRSLMIDSLLFRNMDRRLKYKDLGYRVLIFSQSGNHSKNGALEAKSYFEFIYPETKAYISFEEPYFKVKVGNFYNRYEAEIFLRQIKLDYPYAFIVRDVLDAVDFLKLGEETDSMEQEQSAGEYSGEEKIDDNY